MRKSCKVCKTGLTRSLSCLVGDLSKILFGQIELASLEEAVYGSSKQVNLNWLRPQNLSRSLPRQRPLPGVLRLREPTQH